MAIIFVILGIIFLIFNVNLKGDLILDEKEFDVFLSIAETSGFDLGSESLNFGKIIPGSSVKKEISIGNNYDFPIEVSIIIEGDVSDFIDFEEISLFEVGESKKLSFIATAPLNSSHGNYLGKIYIKMRGVN